jgi:DNA-binding transcriptional MerR regulator
MKNLPRSTVIVDDEKQKMMLKIGDIAKLSGIGIEALRFYEKSGLLDKPARTVSGYRMYTRDVLERLAFIKQAQTLGFSLDEIRRIIDDARTGKSPCVEVRDIVRIRLAEVEERINELKRYHKSISETLKDWDRVGHAPGHICGLIESTHMEKKVGAERSLAGRKRKKG